MQLAANIAQAIDKRLFDVHVNVFKLGPEREFAGFDLASDCLQLLADLLAFTVGDQADFGQHLCVGDRSLNIVGIEAVVEADAFGETFDAAVGAAIADGTVAKLSTKWFGFDITPQH